MSDDQLQGSADAGNPADAGASDANAGSAAAGNPDAQGTVLGEGNGSPPPTDTKLGNEGEQGFDWAGAGFDADNLSKIEAKGWKSPADVLKGYNELERKLGEGSITQPDPETASQEDWDAYYSKLGRPEKPDDYQFKLSESIPADLPYDSAFADQYRQWCHEAGLSPRQADALHSKYMESFAEQATQAFTQVDEKVTNSHNELVKHWGAPEEPGFQKHVDSATRAMRGLGIEDSLKAAGVIHESGAVMDANIALALDRIGASMFREDQFFDGGPSATNNPFADSNPNYTEQSSLIAQDPLRARHLIRAAGKNPSDFGLSKTQ